MLVLVGLNLKAFGFPFFNWLVVPVLHCTQSPISIAHGAYESLEYALSHGIPPLFSLGVLLLTGILVGKLLCGWACPFGFIQDLISYLPFQRKKVSSSSLGQFKDLKWGFLGFSILCCVIAAFRRASMAAYAAEHNIEIPPDAAPLGVFSDSPFSVISPHSTLFAYIPWLIMWPVTTLFATTGMIAWVKIGALVATVAACIIVPRFFCRYICPLAAVLEIVFPFKIFSVKCKKGCRDSLNAQLDAVCPMGCQVTKDNAPIDHPNCIHCGNCIASNPDRKSVV